MDEEGTDSAEYWFVNENGYLVGVAPFPEGAPTKVKPTKRIIGYVEEDEERSGPLIRLNATTFVTDPREGFRAISINDGRVEVRKRLVKLIEEVVDPFETSRPGKPIKDAAEGGQNSGVEDRI